MRVLVACEFSGRVREAFRRRGHDAFSCDLLPSEIPSEYHLQADFMDVRFMLDWDLIVAFPPCTHLAASGARYWKEKQESGAQLSAIYFVRDIYDSCRRVAIENPVGVLSTRWQKPDQIIQPYQFGDPIRKKTCLWLKGLPALIPTNVVEPTHALGTNSYHGGPRKDGTRKRCELKLMHGDGKSRSRTQQGIADAMAEQWGRAA